MLGGFDQTKKNPEHSLDCYKQGKQIVKTTIPVKEDGKNEQAFKGWVLRFSRRVLDYLADPEEEDLVS